MEAFEKVLCRQKDDMPWRPDIFRFKRQGDNLYRYSCMAGNYEQCIPFNGNEHLLNTKDKPFEDLEIGTAVVCRFGNDVRIRAYAGRGGVYTNGRLEGDVTYPEQIVKYDKFISGAWTDHDNIALHFKKENQNGKQC